MFGDQKQERPATIEDITRASQEQALAQQRAADAALTQPLLGTASQGLSGTLPQHTLLGASSSAALNRLNTAPTDFNQLKEGTLGAFDVNFKRYTEDPLKERLVSQGLYSSGPGYELLRRATDEAARNRTLLGNQLDLQADELGRQRINDAYSIGQYTQGQLPLQIFSGVQGNPYLPYQPLPPQPRTRDELLRAAGQLGSAALIRGALASSATLKTDIQPIAHALPVIQALQGVTFDWRDTGRADSGVIAEQVREILPDAVTDVDGVPHVQVMPLIGYLIEAVKELAAHVAVLQARSV